LSRRPRRPSPVARAVDDHLGRDRHEPGLVAHHHGLNPTGTRDHTGNLRVEEHVHAGITQESLGRLLVAPRPHQDVEHHPLLVHGPSQPVPASVDLEPHLIDMPLA